MPQIAQQDYIIIKPAVANSVEFDAAAIGQVSAIMERKDTTIFDVIFNFYGAGTDFQKVAGAFRAPNRAEWTVLIFSGEDGAATILQLPYTPTQYEGLAAVQRAGADIDDAFKEALPVLSVAVSNEHNMLCDYANRYYITDTAGHGIIATVSDGKLAAVEISDVIYTEVVNKVPFEDIQKLIGLPIE